MADVSGSTRSLPGSKHRVPHGQTCDEHSDRIAVARIQGETDSFGAEYFDMCQECYNEFRNRDQTDERTGCCDWCGKHSTKLHAARDYDEGMCGPVYRVCDPCIVKQLSDSSDYFDE